MRSARSRLVSCGISPRIDCPLYSEAMVSKTRKVSGKLNLEQWFFLTLGFLTLSCACLFFAYYAIDAADRYSLIPKWSSQDAILLCTSLSLDENDVFCVDQSTKTTLDLSHAINRRFVPEQAQYSDIMPYLQSLPITSEYGCQPADASGKHSRSETPEHCPLPESCSRDYYCVFLLPDKVSKIVVYFSPQEGIMMSVGTTWPTIVD